jgi:hypothetical protein
MSDWSDLTTALKGTSDTLPKLLQSDDQLKAFVTSNAIDKPVTFGIKSSASDNTLLVTVTNGSAKASTGTSKDAVFILSALPEQWEQYFKPIPAMPYQSYWGMFGLNVKQKGIEVLGDQTAFVQWSHVWRRVLELTHEAHCGPIQEEEQAEPDNDFLTGKYTYLEAPVWGRWYACFCSLPTLYNDTLTFANLAIKQGLLRVLWRRQTSHCLFAYRWQ